MRPLSRPRWADQPAVIVQRQQRRGRGLAFPSRTSRPGLAKQADVDVPATVHPCRGHHVRCGPVQLTGGMKKVLIADPPAVLAWSLQSATEASC